MAIVQSCSVITQGTRKTSHPTNQPARGTHNRQCVVNLASISVHLKFSLKTGAGVREDVFLIWKELEEARYTRLQVQRILANFEEPESPKGMLKNAPLLIAL